VTFEVSINTVMQNTVVQAKLY